MCRLAFVPPKCKVSKGELFDLFDYLELQCGGDGNGYVLSFPDGTSLSEKGVKLSSKDILKKAFPSIRKGAGMLWHTRKVSVGWISDRQCHPHPISGGKAKGHLIHNGTWYDGATLASYLGCGSDTAALAKVIGKFGIKEAERRGLFPKSGVFLLELDGELRAIKKGGDLYYCRRTGVFASDFPFWWPDLDKCTYEVDAGSHSLLAPPPQAPPRAITVGKAYKYESKSIWAKASAMGE